MSTPTPEEHRYNLAVEYFEQDCEIEVEKVHEALVLANILEFNHSGYDAMAVLCDNNHEMHYIYPEHPPLTANFQRGIAYHVENVWKWYHNVVPFDVA